MFQVLRKSGSVSHVVPLCRAFVGMVVLFLDTWAVGGGLGGGRRGLPVLAVNTSTYMDKEKLEAEERTQYHVPLGNGVLIWADSQVFQFDGIE